MDPVDIDGTLLTRMTASEAMDIAANIKRGLTQSRRAAQAAHSLPGIGSAVESLVSSAQQGLDLLTVFIRQQERRNEELQAQISLLSQRLDQLEQKQ